MVVLVCHKAELESETLQIRIHRTALNEGPGTDVRLTLMVSLNLDINVNLLCVDRIHKSCSEFRVCTLQRESVPKRKLWLFQTNATYYQTLGTSKSFDRRCSAQSEIFHKTHSK